MPKEKLKDSPDSWVPGVFGMFNNKALREGNQRRWEVEAEKRNSSRPLGQKSLVKGKTSPEEVMVEEAHADNEDFDKEYPRVPDALYHQKLGEEILAESGIDPRKKFESAEDLETALNQSDVPYSERTDRAAVKVRPELASKDKAA